MKTKTKRAAATAKPKSNLRQIEISPYLWGRIGVVAKLDQLSREQVITAALLNYIEGEEACGRYLDKIDPPENYPARTPAKV
jgi:hypothetical protein